jgi:hypothetical protein
MSRARLLALAGLSLLLAAPAVGHAQGGWTPPSRQMPAMPRSGDLRGDWMAPRSAWFQGSEQISGVAAGNLRAMGEPRPGSEVLQIARFTSGPVPVQVWSDRNGDGRCDMLELYRAGGMIIQVIDPDYDGNMDVVRYYDAGGKLLREERM